MNRNLTNFVAISCVAYIFSINIIDTVFTIVWLKANLAYEANPIMAYAYALSPHMFIAIKFIACASALYLLWIARLKRPVVVPLILLTLLTVYTWVLLEHVQGCAEFINAINMHQSTPIDRLIIPTGPTPELDFTMPLLQHP